MFKECNISLQGFIPVSEKILRYWHISLTTIKFVSFAERFAEIKRLDAHEERNIIVIPESEKFQRRSVDENRTNVRCIISHASLS